MGSVLQPWLENIPLRMQSTLILSLRGPDTHCCPGIKAIQRWMRGLAFKPGNPANVKEFMGSMPPRDIAEKSALAKELEFCTQHFYSHLMHGLEVLGYRHPNNDVRHVAYGLFRSMSVLMHLTRETPAEFEERLKETQWPGGQQPSDFDEAVMLLEIAEDKR